MNAITNFAAIASLLLAVATAGAVANKQTDVNSPGASRSITPSKLGLNHNETMVSEAASVQQADTLSEWLMNLQTSVFTRFSSYLSTRGPCENWGCGSNHNETFLQDSPATRQAPDRSMLTTGEQAAAFAAGLLIKFFIYLPTRGPCEEWGCGSNHNETFLQDSPATWQAPDRRLLTTGEQAAALATGLLIKFFSYLPTRGPCEEWGCGMNHNEMLVIDATPVPQRDIWSEGLRGEPTFGSVRVLLYPSMAGCPVWVCGMNHNETIVSRRGSLK